MKVSKDYTISVEVPDGTNPEDVYIIVDAMASHPNGVAKQEDIEVSFGEPYVGE
jgi:predicted RNA-binding protein associated with RNAse of E/G family